MFCKSKCTQEKKIDWLSIDGDKPSLINLKNITIVSLDNNKINIKMCDGSVAAIDTKDEEEGKKTFLTIANVIYAKR